MNANTANELLARSLGRLEDQAEAEQRNVWGLWWLYGMYTHLLADLEALPAGAEPAPIETPTDFTEPDQRVYGREIAAANFIPLPPLPAAALASEAVHRARTVAVLGAYAARLLDAAAAAGPGVAPPDERRRLVQRAAWADTRAAAAETALQRIPDQWAAPLHDLEAALDARDTATRTNVTRLPVHLRV